MVLENAIIVYRGGSIIPKETHAAMAFSGDDAVADARNLVRQWVDEIEARLQQYYKIRGRCRVIVGGQSCGVFVDEMLDSENLMNAFMLQGGFSFDGGIEIEVLFVGEKYKKELANAIGG